MAGPYKILEKVGNSYKIDFPESMRIHRIISPDRLRKAANDPLPGQTNEPPPLIIIEKEQEWEVEQVLAVRTYYGKLQYRVQWLGFDYDPEWYYASNLKYAPHKLRDFHNAHLDRPGPLRKLADWLKLWEDGVDIYEYLNDDKPA